MKIEEKKMTLEQYLLSFTDLPSFSRFHLNQIIEMHGFVKLHNQHKSRLLEALDSIDLVNPVRSTLADSISSYALLEAEELTADMEAIGWRDCRVRTVETLKSKAELEQDPELPFIRRGATSADRQPPRRRRRRLVADFVIVGKRSRSKRKRVSLKELISSVTSPSSKEFLAPLPVGQRPVTPPPPPSSPPVGGGLL